MEIDARDENITAISKNIKSIGYQIINKLSITRIYIAIRYLICHNPDHNPDHSRIRIIYLAAAG